MRPSAEPGSDRRDRAITAEVGDPPRVMSQAKDENFPVASFLAGGRRRRDLLAIYGYARLVDDIGDEAAGDRMSQLAAIEEDVARLYSGRPHHPLIQRLHPVVQRLGIPPAPFLSLIEANRRDQTVSRYDTFEQLLAYCRLSANPVGELVLLVLGAHTPENVRSSDAVCSALQVVEHLQDVSEDLIRGRIYLPQEDLARFGVGIEDLSRAAASPDVRALVLFQADRARTLLDSGASLVGRLTGRARIAVGGFVAGGRAALDAIVAVGGDVLAASPRPTRVGLLRHLAATTARGR